MEQTFFRPKLRAEKKAQEKKAGETPAGDLSTRPTGATIPAGGDLPVARVETCTFLPGEVAALSQIQLNQTLDTSAGEGSFFRLMVGETPQAFVHLYAGLERLVNKVGDIRMISGDLMEAERPYVIGVTSALAGEGKTTTALHLAITTARNTPKRVCLVDLSLGESDLGERLGMPPRTEGLVAAVENDRDTVPCFTMPGCENLMVIPAGRAPENPAKFARLPRISHFLMASRHAFDVVIIDMPAVMTENAVPLCRHADGMVVVVRAGVTPHDAVKEALDKIGQDRINCVVLNRAKPSMPKWLHKRYNRF